MKNKIKIKLKEIASTSIMVYTIFLWIAILVFNLHYPELTEMEVLKHFQLGFGIDLCLIVLFWKYLPE